MSYPGAAARIPELDELALRLAGLASGNADALRDLHPTLHRIVVRDDLTGAVKTLVVQALLLLDDPRILEGTSSGGAPLIQKIRKLLESAMAAHAANVTNGVLPTPARGVALTRAEFSPDALLSPDTDAALVEEFVIESREQLAIAESALLLLDSDPDDMQAVDTMFRALHTIKGTSAFLGVEHATELAHHAESVLTHVRSGAVKCAGELSNLLFRAIDMLDAIIVAIESAVASEGGHVAMLPDGYRALLDVLRAEPIREPVAASRSMPRVSGSMRRLRLSETTVRIRAAELDRLADVVRDLMLSHAMLARDSIARAPQNADLTRKIAHAASIAQELERVSIELRTVPFASTLQRLARLTRDISYQSGKSVDLETQGETVMVERATADALAEALMHMVRNAVDHGIEGTGKIRISAHRKGAHLIIEVSDDGRGLDAGKLMRRAIERGIIAPGVKLSEQETFALILRPGFSTAAVVTDLSGRGVGMDVVRSNIEVLGGTIEIRSRVGEGTTFTIRVPYRSHPAPDVDTWGEPPRTIGLLA